MNKPTECPACNAPIMREWKSESGESDFVHYECGLQLANQSGKPGLKVYMNTRCKNWLESVVSLRAELAEVVALVESYRLEIDQRDIETKRAAASTRSLAGVPDAGGALAIRALLVGWKERHAVFYKEGLFSSAEVVRVMIGELEYAYRAAQRAAPLPDAARAVVDAAIELCETGAMGINKLRSAVAAPPPAPAPENGETE